MTMYRILAGQYLLQKCKITSLCKRKIERILMGFAQDPNLDYDLRADSADTLLQLGSKASKKASREIIILLGRQNRNVRTIFENAQNTHVIEIEKSIIEVLEFLTTLPLKTHNKLPITFEYVKKSIEKMLEKKEKEEEKKEEARSATGAELQSKEEKIQIALNRIAMDRTLYGKFNCTLANILLKVWTYISDHKCENEMRKRLLEELLDMSGKCTTGFVGRLVNVISGFGKFNLRISFSDQIIANLQGRLNARIRAIEDEEFKGDILAEMSLVPSRFKDRKNFLKFFRENMLSIREQMYLEFREYIDDPSFDLFFRKAIMSYEGCI